MKIKVSLKLTIKKQNRVVIKESLYISTSFAQLAKAGLRLFVIGILSASLFLTGIAPYSEKEYLLKIQQVKAEKSEVKLVTGEILQGPDIVEEKSDIRESREISLQEKYHALAGPYYYSNVEPYLSVVDKVLTLKGLDNDAFFIQAMFFIGQYESHWNTRSVSSSTYGGEHPTGIFQFLPSTFRSVSRGNIYDAESQIWAYVAMVERGRVREFGTLYISSLNPMVKAYVVNFSK